MGEKAVYGESLLGNEQKTEKLNETTNNQRDVGFGCLWVASIDSLDDWNEMLEGKRESFVYLLLVQHMHLPFNLHLSIVQDFSPADSCSSSYNCLSPSWLMSISHPDPFP